MCSRTKPKCKVTNFTEELSLFYTEFFYISFRLHSVQSLLCLDTPQPGSVFKETRYPAACNSYIISTEYLIQFLIRIVPLCLEMLSVFKYYFGFLFEGIFELGHRAIKSRCSDTNLENICTLTPESNLI